MTQASIPRAIIGNDLKSFVTLIKKPFSYIILPDFECTNKFDEVVKCLREDYNANIKIEMSDFAAGISQVQPPMQNERPKASAFRTIDGNIKHDVEDYESRLIRQEQNGEKQDRGF